MLTEKPSFRGKMGVFRSIVAACLFSAVLAPLVSGQQGVKRIMAQDSTLNNLVDPPGYQTAPLGSLGNVKRAGKGTPMILIAGLGFGGEIFDEFMEKFADQYKMYAVTLPGFGGTAAPPCPSEKTSFGEQTWTNGALAGIEKLIKEENIQNPIIVGHWLGGTQIALRLAMRNPERVKAVVLLSGAARLFFGDTTYARYYGTLEKRAATIDNYFAPRWFKTVTRETWDDNNFLPGDYAANPVRGLRLWRQAALPRLHVWVRYLCEFNAQDITFEMGKLTVPTLLLKPGLEGVPINPGLSTNYMENYCHKSWEGSFESNPKVSVKTIPNSCVCLWFDQPEEVHQAVADFLKKVE
ncbi:MAG: alpha/beta hydrolase [candidate division Zixibacteria bacterium]|nr:alpha/beta hydrolase [candidate division Zixibacteria bacterium]